MLVTIKAVLYEDINLHVYFGFFLKKRYPHICLTVVNFLDAWNQLHLSKGESKQKHSVLGNSSFRNPVCNDTA